MTAHFDVWLTSFSKILTNAIDAIYRLYSLISINFILSNFYHENKLRFLEAQIAFHIFSISHMCINPLSVDEFIPNKVKRNRTGFSHSITWCIFGKHFFFEWPRWTNQIVKKTDASPSNYFSVSSNIQWLEKWITKKVSLK